MSYIRVDLVGYIHASSSDHDLVHQTVIGAVDTTVFSEIVAPDRIRVVLEFELREGRTLEQFLATAERAKAAVGAALARPVDWQGCTPMI